MTVINCDKILHYVLLLSSLVYLKEDVLNLYDLVVEDLRELQLVP